MENHRGGKICVVLLRSLLLRYSEGVASTIKDEIYNIQLNFTSSRGTLEEKETNEGRLLFSILGFNC